MSFSGYRLASLKRASTIGTLSTQVRSSLRAAGKTLNLGTLSLLPSAARLQNIDIRESRHDNLSVRSYTSPKSDFPVSVLHGLTREGFDDARLVRFCRMLAAVGFCVYTPNLQGLCMMDPEPADIDSIKTLLKTLVKEQRNPIGLIGFSFGGTYAVLASASPEIAGQIRFVLAVGAYYSLAAVVERAFSLRGRRDLSPEVAYALLALDWKFRKVLPLTEEESIAFEELMDHFCAREKNFTPADTALVAKITSLQQQEDIFLLWKNRLPEIFSLNIEGNSILESLEACVFLLHSKHDKSIPVEETLRIAAELKRLNKKVSRHIGRMGDHVTFSIRSDAGLARFFYQMMLLTELRTTGIPGRNVITGSTVI